MRHEVRVASPDCKKASAEGNIRATKPKDVTRSPAATRMESSSSTIEMIGLMDSGTTLRANQGQARLSQERDIRAASLRPATTD